jgi:hypothetical protein
LNDAFTYGQMKQMSYLQCSIVDKDLFKRIRDEQEEDGLNCSKTWLKTDSYRKESKEPKRGLNAKVLKPMQKLIA